MLVDRIVRIAREHGIEPASPDDTRDILDLKGSFSQMQERRGEP